MDRQNRQHHERYRGKNSRYHAATRAEREFGLLSEATTNDRSDERPYRPKHPPHLKGREIGLYYSNLNKKNRNGKERPKKADKAENLPQVNLDVDQMKKLARVGEDHHSSSFHQEMLSDCKGRYEKLKDSDFKEKFLEVLNGNEDSHFAKTSDHCRPNSDHLKLDEELDMRLYSEFCSKVSNSDYKAMMESRCKLPVFSKKEEILNLIERNQVVVIKGETGCGKTTQIAQFLLDHFLQSKKGSMFNAICTQPRRLAAISVAQRVAQERCEPCGNSTSSVGYQIRLEYRPPRKKGSILYCTTGILVQYLQSDPFLENVSHLLLDEVHERDVLSDFILTVVRDLLPKRPNLKVILMSATINADMFSQYFHGCPSIDIPGLTFPVQDFYLEDVLTKTGFRVRPRCPKRFRPLPGSPDYKKDVEYTEFIMPYVEELQAQRSFPCHVLNSLRMRESEESPEELIVELLHHICTQEGPGAILVFLSGWEQISRLHRTLTSDRLFSTSRFLIIPLHSMMPTVNQRQVFDRPPRGTRKIILSTNIAETSLTIDDVVYVIDSGRTKMSGFDAAKNLSTLQSEWIALANARQRKGRAGRVQPGICYRLYTRFRENSFAPHPIPEMQRMRLEEVILRIKILKLGQVETFLQHVPEAPDPRTVQVSLELLRTLGALDPEERLTPLGFHLGQLPVDPRTGKLILMGAIFGCLEPILSIAATLSFKDPFVIPLNKEDLVRKTKKMLALEMRSDHLLIVRVLRDYRVARTRHWSEAKDYCHRNFLSSSTMSMLCDMVDQFAKDLHQRQFVGTPSAKDPAANVNSHNNKLIRAILCAGLYPNIAKVKMITRRKMGKPGGRLPPPIIRTPEDGKVTIHPKSLNYDEKEFESSWLIYHTKVKTTAVFLHDCSEVSPVALMFFGGKIQKQNMVRPKYGGRGSEYQVVDIGPEMAFRCHQSTVDAIETLRRRLDELLTYRVSHPGPTDWSSTSSHSLVLKAIVDVLTAEGTSSSGNSYEFQARTSRFDESIDDDVDDDDGGDEREDDEPEPEAGSSRNQEDVPDRWEDRDSDEAEALTQEENPFPDDWDSDSTTD